MQLDTKELSLALKALSGVASKESESLLSHIFFSKKGAQLFAQVSDDTLIKSVNIPYSKELVEFNCSYKALSEFVKIAKSNYLNISLDAQHALLSSAEQTIRLKEFDPKEATLLQLERSLNSSIKEPIAISDALYSAIAMNNKKPELNGMLLDLERQTLVATDTRRLAVEKIEFSVSKEFDIKGIIIPKEALKGCATMSNIRFSKEAISFANEKGTHITTKLILGKYPEYERIIPKLSRISIRANGLEIREALKPLRAKELHIKHKSNSMFISYYENEQLVQIVNLACDYNSDLELSYALGASYLYDAITCNEITIELNDYNLPLMVAGSNSKSVIMPIVTDETHPHTIEKIASALKNAQNSFRYKTQAKRNAKRNSTQEVIQELKERVKELEQELALYKRNSKVSLQRAPRELHNKAA